MGWFQLDGTFTPIGEGGREAWWLRLSRDGDRVLFRTYEGGDMEVWAHDLERGISTLLFASEGPGIPIFLPDDRIAVATPDGTKVYARSGKGEPEPLADRMLQHVSDDGSVWVWSERPGGDLIWSRDERCTDPSPLLAAQDNEVFQDLSSDGAWMLYSSKRTGEMQVYLSRFPPKATEDWPVSAKGSGAAWFLEDRSAIVFVDEEDPRTTFRVSFEADPEVKLGLPEPLFAAEPGARTLDFDGVDRFLGSTQPAGRRELVFTTEWKELLR